jgi:formylmethanofuran dehydrogenase subunit E
MEKRGGKVKKEMFEITNCTICGKKLESEYSRFNLTGKPVCISCWIK